MNVLTTAKERKRAVILGEGWEQRNGENKHYRLGIDGAASAALLYSRPSPKP